MRCFDNIPHNGALPVAAPQGLSDADQFAGQRIRNVDRSLAGFRDPVAARAERIDPDFHQPSKRAAMKNSILPSAPLIGLCSVPKTVQPARPANQSSTRQQAVR